MEALLALALLKILATTLSFSSGTPGGMFAPTLFIGAMLGASIGTFEKIHFPGLHITVGAYALVGMGVLFAAFLRVPLTSVFMVLEVSGNYSIILPVILANTIAYLVSRSLQPHAIFEVFTHQDGLDLPSMEEQREEVVLHLEDALRPLSVPIIDAGATLSAAAAELDAKASGSFPGEAAGACLVLDDARRAGQPGRYQCAGDTGGECVEGGPHPAAVPGSSAGLRPAAPGAMADPADSESRQPRIGRRNGNAGGRSFALSGQLRCTAIGRWPLWHTEETRTRLGLTACEFGRRDWRRPWPVRNRKARIPLLHLG